MEEPDVAFPIVCDSDYVGNVPLQVRPGLAKLLQAYVYAQDLERDVWDFALEINDLRSVGLSNSDFRWLICAGYVKHARDMATPGDAERFFRPDKGLVFSDHTCFVLTETGMEAASLLAAVNGNVDQESLPSLEIVGPTEHSPSDSPKNLLQPRWDGERHQLHFGGFLVKEFKVHSPNQEAVLAAFEEEGWPPRIDDPLAHSPELDQKERLRNTIKSLNRTRGTRLIRFMGDGTGLAIRWEPIVDGQNGIAPRNQKH